MTVIRLVDPPDEVAVERAVHDPQPPQWLTREERRLAGHELIARGESVGTIAARLQVAERTVHRWRNDTSVTHPRRSAA